MDAIPTTYNGINFRSRLEAKWAAFFDNYQWPYEYEPFDLDGWIPDFILLGKVPTLVEVKPIVKLDPKVAGDMVVSARKGNRTEDLLLLGCTPFVEHDAQAFPAVNFGWLCERINHDPEGVLDPVFFHAAVLARWKGDQLGFCSDTMSYQDRITGMHNGTRFTLASRSEIDAAWKSAGNFVQWFRRR